MEEFLCSWGDRQFWQGDFRAFQFDSASLGEIFPQIRQNLRQQQNITAVLGYQQVAHCLSADAKSHQRTQNIPMPQGISIVPDGSQGSQSIRLWKRILWFKPVWQE